MKRRTAWLLTIVLLLLTFVRKIGGEMTVCAETNPIPVQACQGGTPQENALVFAITGVSVAELDLLYQSAEETVTLRRASGETLAYSKVSLRTTKTEDGGGVVVKILHSYLSGYAFEAGDCFTVGGVWQSDTNALYVEPFEFLYGESWSEYEVKSLGAAKEEEDSFRMLTGAQMRLGRDADDVNGLRFHAEIGKDLPEDATFFMLIFPEIYLTVLEREDDYYREIHEKIGGFLANIPATPFRATLQDAVETDDLLTEGYYYLRGSLVDIQYENLNLDFFAIAYYIDGDGAYHYADVPKSADGEYGNSRSLGEVANAFLADVETYPEGFVEEERKRVLLEYVAAANAQKAGISKEDYEAGKNS